MNKSKSGVELISLLGGNRLEASIMLKSKEERTSLSLFSKTSPSTSTSNTSDKGLSATTPRSKVIANKNSSSDNILWDTKVKQVNPSADIVLAPYKQFSGALFYGRICALHEAGNC